MITLGIIGYGYVGSAIGKAVLENTDYDLFISDKYKNINQPVDQADIIFLCVPTPMKETGEIDLSNIEDALSDLKSKNKLIVIKSTITPFTTRYLSSKYDHKFIHSPEFLKENNSFDDFLNSDRIVIGAETVYAFNTIKEIYSQILNRSDIKFFHVTWEDAEFCKYVANSFLALKVSFANEIHNACKKLGFDWGSVRKMWASDGRIGDSHTFVPGPDGYYGFGGKCFPKDVNAILSFAKMNNLSFSTIEAAKSVNDSVRDVKDWEHITGATSKNNYE